MNSSLLREMLVGLGANLNPAATDDMIHAAERLHNICIPESAVALYKSANGACNDFGRWSWRFWGIDAPMLTLAAYVGCSESSLVPVGIRNINPFVYVRIFDCLINAPLYVYCADPRSPHFEEVIGCWPDGGPDQLDCFVATTSLERFLELASSSRFDDLSIEE